MRRSLNSSTPSATSSPLTRAQLQAAIESEERRQGLAPDSLVSETTVEEAAKKLGLSPDELRERALQAPSVAVKPARAASPLWTPFNRKLFTFGIVLAVALTGLEGLTRLGIGRKSNVQRNTAQQDWSWSSISSIPKFSPIDARFKSLLAQTVGPDPKLKMVVGIPGYTSQIRPNEEYFQIAGVPDGYDLYAPGGNYLSAPSNSGIVFRPINDVPQKKEEKISPWKFVRLGNRWYARGWALPRTLASKLLENSQEKFVTLHDEISPKPMQNASEIVIPARSVSNLNGISLPRSFRPDPALLASTKKQGIFRTTIPTHADTPETRRGSTDLVFHQFLRTGFSVSSNLVELSKIKEKTPIRIPGYMIPLITESNYAMNGKSLAIRQVICAGGERRLDVGSLRRKALPSRLDRGAS